MGKNINKFLNSEALPDAMSVDDMKRYLGIGRVQAYEQIKKNDFHYVKIGRSIRISKKAFLQWFDGQDTS
ncbi:helix-turn-helix domain-containing protein [Paenibacillus qinlingensis]|uniref:helix-turn-helix domain-containing protein n=1 Tax=Paenibacillus qinlingensis TaxID=1837343 RepID=UPI001FE7C382|nr:helix-turn-helix domain-containing protein [Paenibacillus qinlingensis]